jgi:hypothetical protein
MVSPLVAEYATTRGGIGEAVPCQPSWLAVGNEYSTGMIKLSLTPWQGLGVVALWTSGALLLGALALKFRDA